MFNSPTLFKGLLIVLVFVSLVTPPVDAGLKKKLMGGTLVVAGTGIGYLAYDRYDHGKAKSIALCVGAGFIASGILYLWKYNEGKRGTYISKSNSVNRFSVSKKRIIHSHFSK